MISFGMMICGFTAIRIMVHITDMDGADHGDMDIMAMPDGMTHGIMVMPDGMILGTMDGDARIGDRLLFIIL